MGTFKGTFETKKHFKMIPTTGVACNENHGLIGIDTLKLDNIKFINSTKAEENNIGFLKGHRASIHLKENHHPSYVESY